MINIIFAIVILGIAAYIDSKERIVPDWLSLGGIGLGIALSTLMPSIHDATTPFFGLISAIGDCFLVICGMCLYASFVENVLGNGQVLGGGDVKIMGAIASMVNIKVTICVLLLSPIFGLINYACERMRHEVYEWAYCPSIFMALVFSAAFWRPIIRVIA